jgi:uncharacterized DUF497 family protein
VQVWALVGWWTIIYNSVTVKVQVVVWLDEVEDKIVRKHQVWPDEAEEVLLANPHVRFMERGHRPGEDLYAAFGQTTDGRYLAVFFLLKPHNTALVITARDMSDKERRRYGKRT